MSRSTLGRHGILWIVLAVTVAILGVGAALCRFALAVQVAAAVATLAAVVYASDAAHEARSLRREERLARLPELVAELAANLYLAFSSTYDPIGHRWFDASSTRERLRAAIEAVGENLPACQALTTSPVFPASEEERQSLAAGTIVEARSAAMDELVDVLRRAAGR